MLRIITTITLAASLTIPAHAQENVEGMADLHTQFKQNIMDERAKMEVRSDEFRATMRSIMTEGFEKTKLKYEKTHQSIKNAFAKYDANNARYDKLTEPFHNLSTNIYFTWVYRDDVQYPKNQKDIVPFTEYNHPSYLKRLERKRIRDDTYMYKIDPERVLAVLKATDDYLTSAVIYYKKYVRPTLINNIRYHRTGNAAESISLCYKQAYNPRFIPALIERLTKYYPEVKNAKFAIAALEMVNEIKTLEELSLEYLGEIQAKKLASEKRKNKALFKQGKELDYNALKKQQTGTGWQRQ